MFIYKVKKILKPYSMAIVSVVIAILALAIVSLITSVGKTSINKELDGIGLNGVSITAYNTNNENITDIFMYDEIKNINSDNVSTPVLYDYSQLTFANYKENNAMAWGIAPTAKDIVSLDIIYGRMLSDADINNNEQVCLVDRNIALQSYKRENIVGKEIFISIGEGTYRFKIIGIVQKGSSVLNELTGDVLPNFIYLPYTTMADISQKQKLDQILIKSENSEDISEKIQDIFFKETSAYKDVSLKINNLAKQRDRVNNIVDVATAAIFLVSCVAVLVCSISIASSVNTAVSIQQKDIGIKTSLGASRFNIVTEFLTNAVFSCIFGILVSIIVIFTADMILNSPILRLNYSFDYRLISYGIFVTIALTAIFSFFPSWQAAKLTPIKALSRE